MIGSIDTCEFLVAVAASLGFLFSLGLQGIDWTWAAAILLGGVVAAPVAAYLARHVPPRLLGSLVGGMIILTNTRSLLRSDWIDTSVSVQWLFYAPIILIWAAAIAYSVHQYVTDKARESSDALHREFTEREAALVAVGGPGADGGLPGRCTRRCAGRREAGRPPHRSLTHAAIQWRMARLLGSGHAPLAVSGRSAQERGVERRP